MKIIGITKLHFKVGDVVFLCDFLIADNLPIDGLLGNSFISRFITSIRVGAKCATFKQGKRKFLVPLVIPENESTVNSIRIIGDHTLEPHSTRLVETRADKENCNGNAVPHIKIKDVQYIYTSHGRNNKLAFALHNCSNEPKFLPNGTKIGKNIEAEKNKEDDKPLNYCGIIEQESFDHESFQPDDEDDIDPERITYSEEKQDLDKLSFDYLESEEETELISLIKEFSDIFDGRLGLVKSTKHQIDLIPGAKPVLLRPYRRSPKERAAEAKCIKEMLDMEVIEPTSSPWGFPNVLIMKNDGRYRITTNFKKLNALTVKDAYPLPRIDDALDLLGGSKYFTVVDANCGFFQVLMDDSARDKVVMISFEGTYGYKRMPLGLINSPSTFQRLMDILLAGLKWKCCIVYMDDIIIFSKTFEDHIRDLRAVFTRLREAGLTLKLTKCTFARDTLPYLGYIISRNGIKPNPEKVKAVTEMIPPENISAVRSFLGMLGFFRMFIKDFAKIAKPLTDLTKKGVIPVRKAWSEEHQFAFETLKNKLLQAPILSFPNFKEHFYLETDASNEQIGAVLMQKPEGKCRVIGYYSRKLNSAEVNYTTTEKECLAVVWAVTHKCRPYLHGQKFTVITDHSALRWLLNLENPTGRLARWGLKLMEYDFEVVTRPGRVHSVPDALSRLPTKDEILLAIKKMNPIIDRSGHELPSLAEFKESYLEDDFCKKIISYFRSEARSTPPKEAKDVIMEDDILYKLDIVPKGDNVLGYRVIVPKNLVEDILTYYHNAMPNGHQGIVKTFNKIREKYYWPKMQKDIYEFVSICDTCIRNKSKRPKKNALMKAITPSRRFELVAMDILKLNKTHKGHTYVLVITDMFTKFCKASAMADSKAETVAESFVNDWLSIFGAPEKLLTDQGSQFTSALFLSLCRILGIKKIFTTPYHPQTDGVVERNNQTLVKIMSMYVATDQKNWDDVLSMAVYAHNTARHSTTQQTPYKMMFGVEAPDFMPEAYEMESVYQEKKDSSFDKIRSALAEAHRCARNSMKKAQAQYKKYYDKNVTILEFNKGDLVYLWQPSTPKEGSPKLTAPWRGPFRVKERINDYNVILTLPTVSGEGTMRVHVNRLRKANEAMLESTPLAIGPLHENLPEGYYFVDRIISERRREGKPEFRIRWKGYSAKHDTWEPELNLPPIIVNEYRAMIRAKKTRRDDSA